MEIPGEWSDFDFLGLVGKLSENDFFGGGMGASDLLVLEIKLEKNVVVALAKKQPSFYHSKTRVRCGRLSSSKSQSTGG